MLGKIGWNWSRWALVTVPLIVALGVASAMLARSGPGNAWYDALILPPFMPPVWAFPLAWTILYILMGIAIAMILAAPKVEIREGEEGRGKAKQVAIIVFLGQLTLNLAWSPVFFGQHRIMLAFGLIVMMFAWAGIATIIFWHIRRAAGMLMLPYLAWLLFAGLLNWQIHILNPSNGALAGPSANTQITIN